MADFNPLNFIADHAGMNLVDAIKEAYERGKMDAQPKTGKWIPCDVDIRGMTNMFVCSKCGSFTSLPILKYANAMEYDFCPNCGADMRGEKDE